MVGLGACRHDLDAIDGSFYGGGDVAVHCAVDIDVRTKNTVDSIDTGLD
ncbi:MAG: hypothetical protein H0T79_19690, partial [Deltaproteobacteria bacterium]|nr:hypothetical protein [Deltaproteobacteria bacterium]